MADGPGAERELARLRDAGVVRALADGRVWFDLRCHYQAQAHRQGVQAAIGIGVALALAGTAMLLYVG